MGNGIDNAYAASDTGPKSDLKARARAIKSTVQTQYVSQEEKKRKQKIAY